MPVVDTAYRKWVAHLIALGLQKKTIATWTGLSQPKVTRWLQGSKARAITGDEIRLLEQQAAKLAAVLQASPANRWEEASPPVGRQPDKVKGAKSA